MLKVRDDDKCSILTPSPCVISVCEVFRVSSIYVTPGRGKEEQFVCDSYEGNDDGFSLLP